MMDAEPVTIPADLPAAQAYEDFFLRYQGWEWFAVVEATAASSGSPTACRRARSARGRRRRPPVRESSSPRGAEGQVPARRAARGAARLRAAAAARRADGGRRRGRLRGVVTLEQVSRASLQLAGWRPSAVSRRCPRAGSAQRRTRYRLARHARTRRPDHRRRTGRPARRARRRGRRGDRGHHDQGPPRPLALQRGRGRHQRRAEPGRLVGVARLRHRQGLGLPRRPGRDRDHVPRGARRGALARAPGRHLPPQPRGQARHPRVRRRLGRPHLLRGRHHRPGAAARALRAADEAPRARSTATRSGSSPRSSRTTRAAAAARSRATSATARWSCSPPRR